MDQLTSSLLILVIGLLIVVTSARLIPYHERPPRCCTPSQWEADMKNMGAAYRTRDPTNKVTGRIAYDYVNKRWAVVYRDGNHEDRNKRVVVNHKKNYKMVVTEDSCYKVPLNMTRMDRYCIPKNATYLGHYDYGLNRELVGYDLWAYDMMYVPVRISLRMSRDQCLALQDSAYTLVRHHWGWKEGEPMCVPWMFPEQAANGECFRSHIAHKVERVGTRPTSTVYNVDFRNINLTITDQSIFDVPTDCKIVKNWPKDVVWSTFWTWMFSRMKLD